jgi:two-component system LytT family response regulator
MPYKVLIIDDEPLARSMLLEYLQAYPQLQVVEECSNGFEGVKAIQQHNPDLIFLDIQMPKITGFEMLELLEEPPAVIFTTAFDEFAVQAFEKNAVDYLLKPLDQERFKLAVDRALQRKKMEEGNIEDLLSSMHTTSPRTSYDSHIFVQKSEKLFNLPVEDIIYLEASGDYTVISTKNDQFVSSSGIGKLEELMNPDRFIRVHRSTIINLTSLKEIERHFNGGMIVKMQNGKTFPVSRTYAKMIRKKVV